MTQKELIDKSISIIATIEFEKAEETPIAYLSGKVTGLDSATVVEKFRKDRTDLLNKGYWVFNPTDYIKSDCEWQMAMRLCLAILPLCDVMFQQPDWHNSKGAIWEYDVAMRLGIEIKEL